MYSMMTSYILTNSRYDLGPPIFLGLVGCFLILLGAMFYAVTVCRVICPERYLNSSIFSLFSVTDEFIPHNKLCICFGLTVKWYMPMEDAHTCPLAPEEEPCTPDTTNPLGCTDLTQAQDNQAAPRSQRSLRQRRQKTRKGMPLCSDQMCKHKKQLQISLTISTYLS